MLDSGDFGLALDAAGASVADPHHFDADPDMAFHFDADPDPDPDPGSGSYCQLGMVKFFSFNFG